jgi:hypothetical protein
MYQHFAIDVTYVPHFVYKTMDITNTRYFTPNTIVYLYVHVYILERMYGAL